ncbi:hypothetical protein FB45DRAFT_929055 [Roridomyces roridus]|uniref:Uncharacterized protein n=1 Tax=Roridomyces roridus TaxID=1738132 RepID=A0AAD7FFS9_9AGAR|nr:hypothetical protein FB45DRAFT_929055 [Roridomyces roridus]
MPPTDIDFQMDEDSSPWIELFLDLIPNPTTLITSIFGVLVFVAIIASPTRLIAILNREIEHASRIYVEMTDTHLLDCRDAGICEQFLALDDEARKLRIKTLTMRVPTCICWCLGLYGLLTGHSLAIWRCTIRTRNLADRIQLNAEAKTQDLNKTLAVGSSPSQQLWLRRRGTALFRC